MMFHLITSVLFKVIFSQSLFKKLIYLLWAVLSFSCCMDFSLVAMSGGCSLLAVRRLLIAAVSHCGSWELEFEGFSGSSWIRD